VSCRPGSGSSPLPPSLIDAFDEARRWGFLGEGPTDVHIAHAQGFADAAERGLSYPGADHDDEGHSSSTGPWMDLGSGGGIPGLVLAHRWAHRDGVLLDSNERRTRFLSEVIQALGWDHRIRVVNDRAEVAGRTESLRGSFSLVVARSFGSPPVTAECAAPFLRLGGILVVSEPPTPPAVTGSNKARWPEDALATVGLEPIFLWRDAFGYQILRQRELCPDRYPRRIGVPAKRPLYRIWDT